MTRKVGFIFLFSNQIPLKPYSIENKENYKTKILLHSFSLITHSIKTDDGFVKACIVKEIESKKHINSIIVTEFNFKKSYIVDYNPIPRKLVKTKDKELTVYTILLNSNFQSKILDLLKNYMNTKVFVEKMLLSYNLKSIDINSPDIFTAIKNYSKDKNLYTRKIDLIYTNLSCSKYTLTLNDIIEGLCGIEELREETKCYI